MSFEIPGQMVTVDTPNGVDPVWYEYLFQMFNSLKLFIARGAYSEGTYIPVLSAPAGTTPPTFTAPTLTGRYVKIGALVTVQVAGNNTSGGTLGAGSGQLSVSLPFPVWSNSIGGRNLIGSWANAGSESLAFAQAAAGVMAVPLYKQVIQGSNSNQTPLTGADFNNAARTVSWVFTYPMD
jgi:hypothetical protein